MNRYLVVQRYFFDLVGGLKSLNKKVVPVVLCLSIFCVVPF